MKTFISAVLISILSIGLVRAQDDRQEDAYTAESRFSLAAAVIPVFTNRIFPSHPASLKNASSMPGFGVDFGLQAGLRISYRSRIILGFFGTNRLYSVSFQDFDKNGIEYSLSRKYHWSFTQVQTYYHYFFSSTYKSNVYLNAGIGHNFVQRLEVTNKNVPPSLISQYPPNTLTHDGLRNAGFTMYLPSLIVGFGLERILGTHFFIGGEPNFQVLLGRVGPGSNAHSIYAIGIQVRVGYQFGLSGNN